MTGVEMADAIASLAEALASETLPSAVARDISDTITLLLMALRLKAGVFK